jgi:hypothetical protein
VVASSRRESVDRAVARLLKGTEGYAIDLSNEEHVRDFFNHLGAFDHMVFTAGEAVPTGCATSVRCEVERAQDASLMALTCAWRQQSRSSCHDL